jgi:cytochrome c peroxidase
LGRELFFDKGLSSTGTVACATCHQPERAFTNGQAKGVGVHDRKTYRNVPTLLNVAFRPLLRWDGYASTLENFTKYPFSGVREMDFHYLDKVVAELRARPHYAAAFRSAMGAEPIEFEHVARALATYMRTLISGDSAFDRYYYQRDEAALDESARRGLALFTGKAECARCHLIGDRYALFMYFKYHFLGVGYDPEPGASEDIGLGAISTNDLSGFFQTPSLRDVAETAPYMHDGSLATLEEVVEFFDAGGAPRPGRATGLRPLLLTRQEKRDLVAFLRSLTGAQRYSADGRRLNVPGG